MADTPKRYPWLLHMHHRMRSMAFALLFGAIALHIVDKNYAPATWIFLGVVLLVYPHLQFWRACKAENPIHAEMRNLLVDSVLLGIVVASVAFPDWITFSAILGTLTNNAANKGWRGIFETILALLAGALIGGLWWGFDLSPQTDWPASLFCAVTLTGYLLAMSNIGFTRNLQLRLTKRTLQSRERDLLSANQALQDNLQEIHELQAQLLEQANRDPLTNLYNRRYLDSTLERELARCKREGQPLSLILIDIDHFKRTNDSYGHQAGDEVLVRLGGMLSAMARAEDVACRYGGEEFLLLMPTMSLTTARERSEELRQTFGALQVDFGEFHLQSTLSIGIAVYPGHGISADELIRHADHALYQAKRKGRNRVEVDLLDDHTLPFATLSRQTH